MTPIGLFSLIPHPQRLSDGAACGQIGPFKTVLTSSYDDAAQLVHNPPTKRFLSLGTGSLPGAGRTSLKQRARIEPRNCRGLAVRQAPMADSMIF